MTVIFVTHAEGARVRDGSVSARVLDAQRLVCDRPRASDASLALAQARRPNCRDTAGIEITRDQDQTGGGGNWFAFAPDMTTAPTEWRAI